MECKIETKVLDVGHLGKEKTQVVVSVCGVSIYV